MRAPGPPRVWIRAGIGLGLLLAAAVYPAVEAVAFDPPATHLRVCFLSTTTEEPSCATVTDSYSPPASEPSPPSP